MQYLVEAENIDGLIPMKDVPDYINHIVIPSYEQLIKLESENKIKGGLLAGQRAGAFVMGASSPEDLGKMLRAIPFWGMVKWKVTHLQSLKSALEQDGHIAKMLSGQ
ncbi:MAG: hypothetical protein ACREBI_07020 [Nitrosotalea sp.]